MPRSLIFVSIIALSLLGASPGLAQSQDLAPPNPPSTVGAVELLSGTGAGVKVSGWAASTQPGRSSTVTVYVDGDVKQTVSPDEERPDLVDLGLGSRIGFSTAVDLTPGRHQVCVYAQDTNPGSTSVRLRCRSVFIDTAAAAPIGEIESVRVAGTLIEVSGWALDPDTTDSIGVHLYVDGEMRVGKPATGNRADIERRFGSGSAHGFGFAIVAEPGSHEICAYGIDHARITENSSLLGCESVTSGADEQGAGDVLLTPSGIAAPVLSSSADGTVVVTPCGNSVLVSGGQRIATVDVLLDPGHGGSEPGSVAPSGLLEKDVNLAVAHKVEHILEARGYTAVLTRSSDVRLPLRYRADVANLLKPKVFVSVHHNGGASRRSSDPGTETFYQHDSAESRRLGGILYEEIHASLDRYDADWVDTVRQGTNARLNVDGEDLYGIHRFTPDVVSVITEGSYLSNPSEAALLERDQVQDAEAVAIADGIVRFLTTEDEGSGFNPTFTDGGSSGTGGTKGCEDVSLGEPLK